MTGNVKSIAEIEEYKFIWTFGNAPMKWLGVPNQLLILTNKSLYKIKEYRVTGRTAGGIS